MKIEPIDSQVWKKLKDNNSSLLKLLKNTVSMELERELEWSNIIESYGHLQTLAKIPLTNGFEKHLFVREPIVYIDLVRYNPYETGLEKYVCMNVSVDYACYEREESISKEILCFEIMPDESIYRLDRKGNRIKEYDKL